MFNNHCRRASKECARSLGNNLLIFRKIGQYFIFLRRQFHVFQYVVLNKRMFELECSSEDVPITNVTNLEEKDGFMAASLMMLLLSQVAAMLLIKVS